MSLVGRRLALVALGGRGGSSIAAGGLAAGFADAGASVTLLTADPVGRSLGRESEPLLRRRCFGPVADGPGAARRLAARLRRLHRRAPLDEVQVHYLTPLLPWVVSALEGLPSPTPRLVAVAHGTDVTRFGDTVGIRLSRARVDRWVVPGPSLVPSLRALGVTATIECVPMGVDLARFRPTDLGEGPPTVVHLTNFRPWKRSTAALAAFAELTRRETRARLRVIGHGPTASRLVHRADRLGLADHVDWLGSVDTSARHFAGARVVLSTSAEESFGLSLVEGLACGLAAVAPDLPGLRPTLGHTRAATLVEHPSPSRLADALAIALRSWNPRLARRHAERFDLRRTVAALAPKRTETEAHGAAANHGRLHSTSR